MSFKLLLLALLAALAQCMSVPVDPVEPVPAEVVAQVVPAQQETSVPVVDLKKEPTVIDRGDIRSARSYVLGNDVSGLEPKQVEESLLKKLNSKCASERHASSCAMLKLVTYMNRLLKTHVDLGDNIEVKQVSEVEIKAEELPRSLNQEPDEAQLAELMTAKVSAFVRSRQLRLRLIPTMDAVLTSNPDSEGNLNLGMSVEHVQPEEGRGKKNMGGLLAAIVMKFGMLGALAFKGLVLLVGKALLISKIALLLAVVLGLKKLFSQQKHVTYEVVAQPHHSHSHVEHVEHGHSSASSGGGHDSYSSGWARTIGVSPVGKGDGQDLAYRGQRQ